MFALVYFSEALTEFDHEELAELCRISSVNNLKVDVTGYLYFRDGNFLQYLEGKKSVVTKLMKKIQADDRHTIKQVIYDDANEDRRFPDWSMRYLLLDSVQYEDAIRCRLELLRLISLDDKIESNVWDAVNKLSSMRSALG